jgi:hypothetical protein
MRCRLALKLEQQLPQVEAFVVNDTGFPKIVRLGSRHDVLAAFFHRAGLSLTGLP